MKLRKCPFCGGEPAYIEHNGIMDKWVLNHFCEKPIHSMSVFIVGDTKTEVEEAWGYEVEESESL